MPVMLERWNDDKMDALSDKVDSLGDRIDRVDLDLRELRTEMNQRFDATHRTMNDRFDAMNQRFDAMHRTNTQTAIAILTAFVVGFGSLTGLIVTQL